MFLLLVGNGIPSSGSNMASQFSSVDNKRIIWSSLVEGGYFSGFPANQKDMVKRVLDSVVHEVSQTGSLATKSTSEKNREVVRQMKMYRDLWAQDGTIGSSHTAAPPHGGQQNQYTSQVTAEDIREQRELAFSRSLQAKQAEMEGYMNGGRPQNIDFSDKQMDERIGGDMERLVAEAEAERRRQMDALFNGAQPGDKDAEKWVNGGRPLKIDNSGTLPIESHSLALPSPRRVRFSDEQPRSGPSRGRIHSPTPNLIGGGEDDKDIFTKLKRRSVSPTYGKDRLYASVTTNGLETVLEEMRELRKEMAEMRKDIGTLLAVHNSDDTNRG